MVKVINRCYFREKLHIKNEMLLLAFELSSKVVTIAIAKFVVKRTCYAMMRTGTKTLLIALLRSALQPVAKFFSRWSKANIHSLYRAIFHGLTFQLKLFIKTTALMLLALVFEDEDLDLTTTQLLFRISMIIAVTMATKKAIKQMYQPKSSSWMANKTTTFALHKLVTKLIKIPLIKLLL